MEEPRTVAEIRHCSAKDRTATSTATIIMNYRYAPKEAGLMRRVHKLLVSFQACKDPAILHLMTLKKPININA
jgi:hypothetical protein